MLYTLIMAGNNEICLDEQAEQWKENRRCLERKLLFGANYDSFGFFFLFWGPHRCAQLIHDDDSVDSVVAFSKRDCSEIEKNSSLLHSLAPRTLQIGS